MAPCHQLDIISAEFSEQACDHCEGQTPCGDACAPSCVSGATAFIPQLQNWLVPAVNSFQEQAPTDNLSVGVQQPIYHPPIRS